MGLLAAVNVRFFVMLTNSIQVLSEAELLEHKFTVYGTAENPLFLLKEVASALIMRKHRKVIMMYQNGDTVDEEEKHLQTIFSRW